MEYSYGKRTKKNNNEARDVIHCWELGNITIVNTLQLQAMLEVTVTQQFVSSMAIVFVVDLSKVFLTRYAANFFSWIDSLNC